MLLSSHLLHGAILIHLVQFSFLLFQTSTIPFAQFFLISVYPNLSFLFSPSFSYSLSQLLICSLPSRLIFPFPHFPFFATFQFWFSILPISVFLTSHSHGPIPNWCLPVLLHIFFLTYLFCFPTSPFYFPNFSLSLFRHVLIHQLFDTLFF